MPEAAAQSPGGEPTRPSVSDARRAEQLLDSLNEIVFRADPQGHWTDLNAAWTRVTGFSVDATLGTSFLDYVHPDEREATLVLFRAVVEGAAEQCHHEGRYRTADGTYRWLELRSSAIRDDDGALTGNAGTLLDISERRQAQDLLREEARILELIARDAPLAETLEAVAVLMATSVGGTVTVEPLPKFLARPVKAVAADAPAPPGASDSQQALRVDIGGAGGGEPLGAIEIRSIPPNAAAAAANLLTRGCHLATVAIQRWRTQEVALHAALHDPLTGLPNRTLLGDRLQQALSTAGRQGRWAVALLLLDLDHFKAINDTLGHAAGDRVLCHVGQTLTAQLRDTDTVARMGGDEFALILPALSEVADAKQVAHKALAALERPLTLDGVVVRLGASVGIAIYPHHGRDPAALFRQSDVAMYRAKRLGGGVAVYDPPIDEEHLRRAGLAAELRLGIEAQQLAVHYQPQIDLRNGRVVGVEGLVRWDHPARGLLAAELFVPLAESTGLIKTLSLWVLRTAIADHDALRPLAPDLLMGVNWSAQQLSDDDLRVVIDGALRDQQLQRGELQLEITESAVMADPEGALRAISALRDVGVSFVIDDFGTDYSARTYLQRLPARAVKIDKSLVRDMSSDERDASIVRSAIELAHDLGISVVAEGVESQRSYDLLVDLGCDYAQGYHLARPMPAAALERWLAGRC